MNKKVAKSSTLAVQPVRFLWGLLCSLSSLDQGTNNLSLFNIIDQFNLPSNLFPKNQSDGNPIIQYDFEIVTVWRRVVSVDLDSREIPVDLKVELYDPDEKAIQSIITPFKFKQGSQRQRVRIHTPGFPVTRPGDYCYKVGIKLPLETTFQDVGYIPLEIKAAG